MVDFWLTSGFHLLRRDADGRLAVTDDFLRAYFRRTEMQPIEESCAAERALHQELLADPRLPVPDERLAALVDPDARENYETVLRFRDLLTAHGILEAAYLALFRRGRPAIPPLFVDHLVHAVLRNLLEGCEDPLRLRAAELLFRGQKVNIQDGAIMVADEEVVEMSAAAAAGGAPGHLLDDPGSRTRSVDLDILDEKNAWVYWERNDRFDTALDIGFARPGLDALCRVLEAWIRHFLGISVAIHPVQAINDERWVWHVGLDAEATAILNELYEGKEIEQARLTQILSLFRLEFQDPAVMLPQVAGRPVYLAMAMTLGGQLRLKPQNLLVNLPLASIA